MGARAEKTQYFSQRFSKEPKNAFLACYFKLVWGAKNLAKTVFLALQESSENQFGRPKKRSTKLSIFFLKIRPPRENPRSTPASTTVTGE